MQKKMQSASASSVHYSQLGEMKKEEISSGNYTKCQSPKVLRKAKSEWNVHETLHNDPFTEIVLMHEILRDEDDTNIHVKGYVQEISYFSLMIVLFKEESLYAAKQEIKAGEGFFYIDATGSVVGKLSHSKTIFYYALVVKSFLRGKPPVPVLEFLLDHQNTYYVMRPLLTFYYT